MTTYNQLENKLEELKTSEFFREAEFNKSKKLAEEMAKSLHEYLGYNDGEALDEDGIEFVIEIVRTILKIEMGTFD